MEDLTVRALIDFVSVSDLERLLEEVEVRHLFGQVEEVGFALLRYFCFDWGCLHVGQSDPVVMAETVAKGMFVQEYRDSMGLVLWIAHVAHLLTVQ
jgi:hypothetical protein